MEGQLEPNAKSDAMKRTLESLVTWLIVAAGIAGFFAIFVFAADRAFGARKPETRYEQARRIVFAVFPDSTQDAALRVVGCETGRTYSPWSYNRRSGASGYFQVLQGNAGRVLHYRGNRLVIPSGRKLFLPWTNARVALFLSSGGTDWHEWVCKP